MSRGFTLIETVIAIGIVGMTVAAVGALVEAAPLARETQYKSQALALAESELESLRAGGYGALPASGAWSAPLMSSLPNGSGKLVVESYDATTEEVAVIVSWQGSYDPSPQSLSLITLITKTGGLP